MLKMNALIAVFKKHRRTDRKVVNDTENQSFDTPIIPHPSSLEIRQLFRTAVNGFH